jgi:hypothetical protein
MATTTPGRAELRAELLSAQERFHEMVARIGDAHWKRPSSIPVWTCGQLAWHTAAAVPFLAGQIEGAKKGKALNPPSFVKPLLFRLSELRVRIASRNATPASVTADFDAGITRVLALLDATDDATLAVSARAMGETRTIGGLFRTVPEHIAEHAAQVLQALDGA